MLGLLLCTLFVASLAAPCDVETYYASFDPDAYSDASSLRPALHDLISANYISLGYSNTRAPIEDLDQDPLNPAHVLTVYKRESIDPSTTPFGSGWNREHLWANSRGLGSSEPEYSDLYNLRAADSSLNSARGNKPFDECTIGSNGCVSPATVKSTGETAAATSASSPTSWTPPASQRGDVARALFYMAVRYEGSESSDLRLVDCGENACLGAAQIGKLSTLLKWHEEDPVDNVEILRVNKICSSYQNNRNPFVDKPELVVQIFGQQQPLEKQASPAWIAFGILFVVVVGCVGFALFITYDRKRALARADLV